MLLQLLNASLDACASLIDLPGILKLVSWPLCNTFARLLVSCCAEMVHAASAAQRLFETPIPVSYTRHTSRSLMLWLLTLPFALWPIMGLSMVPACLFISYVSYARISQASHATYSLKLTHLLVCSAVPSHSNPAAWEFMCCSTMQAYLACVLCIYRHGGIWGKSMCLAMFGPPAGLLKSV